MKNVNEINFLLHEMIDLNLYKIDEITLKLGVLGRTEFTTIVWFVFNRFFYSV